jgi:8-oxo-dGTP diphosphatase
MLQVVAALVERDGRVLIAQRKPGQWHALQWEFPGGKVEPGETPAAAVARELEEELGIEGSRGEEVHRYRYCYPGKSPIELIFIRVREWTGEPRNLVFQDLRWEQPHLLDSYDFLEGDREFLRTYTGRMPSVKTVDPSENEFLKALESKSGKPSPFFRVMANRPEALKNFVPFYGAVAGPGSVERRTKELVYLAVSYANQCAFCSWAHEGPGRKAGISDAELKTLQSGSEEGFSGPELAAIRYAREVTKTANATATRDGLKAHFNDEQIVELTMVAAIANFTNRFNNSLAIFPEQ